MENAKEIIALLTWPHFAFLFAIIFSLMFFGPIKGFINRVRSVGKDGVHAEAPEAQNESKTKSTVVDELLKYGESTLSQELEELIRKELLERQLSLEGDTVKVLIHHLAVTQIALEFEQVHTAIFGSQIELLKRLNEVAGSGRSVEYVNAHFDSVTEKYSDLSEWTIEKYLTFLFDRFLLTLEQDKFHITERGQEFLSWMARYGRIEDKWY